MGKHTKFDIKNNLETTSMTFLPLWSSNLNDPLRFYINIFTQYSKHT